MQLFGAYFVPIEMLQRCDLCKPGLHCVLNGSGTDWKNLSFIHLCVRSTTSFGHNEKDEKHSYGIPTKQVRVV